MQINSERSGISISAANTELKNGLLSSIFGPLSELFNGRNFKIALKLKLSGVYLPSFNKNFRHLNYRINTKFIVLGSAHNLKEIRIKEMQKIEYIFLSLLFPSIKNKNYLGIYKFFNLMKKTKKKVVCLGGITKSNIKTLKNLNLYGMASISYFKVN